MNLGKRKLWALSGDTGWELAECWDPTGVFRCVEWYFEQAHIEPEHVNYDTKLKF